MASVATIPVGSDCTITFEDVFDTLALATLAEHLAGSGTLTLYEDDRITPVAYAQGLVFTAFAGQTKLPVRFYCTIPALATANLTVGDIYYAIATMVITDVSLSQTLTRMATMQMVAAYPA